MNEIIQITNKFIWVVFNVRSFINNINVKISAKGTPLSKLETL